MNIAQRAVLIVGAATFALAGLFPMWIVKEYVGPGYGAAVVHRINLPVGRGWISVDRITLTESRASGRLEIGAEVDTVRLVIEWISIGVITAALMISLSAARGSGRSDKAIGTE